MAAGPIAERNQGNLGLIEFSIAIKPIEVYYSYYFNLLKNYWHHS